MDDEADVNVDSWHQSIVQWLNDRVSENGKYPHRLNGTVHGINLQGLEKLMNLTRYG